jgi:N-acyl-L-homoserine lactone synthetase
VALIAAMIDVVLPDSRFKYAALLMQMHHDRKRVFVDRLGWRLPSPQSWLEVDDFDNEFAVYLLARSPINGTHVGSVRLLPSTKQHMLSSLFRNLCSGPTPVAEDCWEVSRLVTAPPEIGGTSVIKLHRLLALGLLEFAALNSIRHYTVVAETHRVPALLSIGWPVKPLGLPMECMGQNLQALQIAVEQQTALELRTRLQLQMGVLRFAPADRWAA